MVSDVRSRRARNVIALAILVCLLVPFCLLVALYYVGMTATGSYLRVRWGGRLSIDHCSKIVLSEKYYPLVVEAMRRGEVRDAVNRTGILRAIGLWRPGEYEAFLWAVKNDPSASVRMDCLRVLEDAVFEHPEFLAAIIGALDDPDDRVVSVAWRQVRRLTGVELVDSKEAHPPPGTREKWEQWWAEHKDSLVWDGVHQGLRVPEERTADQP